MPKGHSPKVNSNQVKEIPATVSSAAESNVKEKENAPTNSKDSNDTVQDVPVKEKEVLPTPAPMDKLNPKEMKKRLQKCGKLSELKEQLAKLDKNVAKTK